MKPCTLLIKAMLTTALTLLAGCVNNQSPVTPAAEPPSAKTSQAASAPARLKILLTNDDGLTANIRALQTALISAGHAVLIAIPCQNQSGKGASANFLTPIAILTKDCRGGAARAGGNGVGQIAELQQAYYVDGTPIMATMFGLDVAAPKVWGANPDLVISGPNEGQNLGAIVISSGTVSNTQIALARGIPAIAVSADFDTTDNMELAREVAQLTLRFVTALQRNADDALLQKGTALNINIPKFAAGSSEKLPWKSTRFGNVEMASMRFVMDLSATASASAFGLRDVHLPGISFTPNRKEQSIAEANNDSEALHNLNGFITVTPMQQGYEVSSERAPILRTQINNVLKDL